MLSPKEVRKSNAALQSLPPGLVVVFAGATAGIGLGTLRQSAKSTDAPRAYIIGRSRAKASHLIHELKIINPSGTFVFLEGQFSHIKDVDHICEVIKKLETHVDILCMITGAVNFSGNKGELHIIGPQDTTEGIDTDLALQYYSRLHLINNLIPLPEQSISQRVISIFLAGHEGALDLNNPSHYVGISGFIPSSASSASMMTLAFEELAKKHPTISLIHSYPGSVRTDILSDGLLNVPGWLWYPAQIPRYTFLPLYKSLICVDPHEAGERYLFLATNGTYAPSRVHDGGAKGKIEGFVDRLHLTPAARSTINIDGNGNGVYRTNSFGGHFAR